MRDELYESYLPSPYKIGDVGEIITASTLREFGIVVRNLYLPINEEFTEVDIVFLSTRGIFCIENKNYHARIKGDIRSKYLWADYGYGKKVRFFNPIIQNKKHIKALCGVLGTLYVYGGVIFNDNASLRLTNNHNSCMYLSDFFKWHNTLEDNILSKRDMSCIADILREYSDSTLEGRQAFVNGLEVSV